MQGPYHSDLYDTARAAPSWWERTAAPPPARPALEGDIETEIAIIGGGYAGLSCAEALGARGIGAVVLDAGEIGWGASGRNGGIVGLGSDKLGATEIARRWGEAETRAYFGAYVDNARRIRTFCEAEGVETQGAHEAFVAQTRGALDGLRSEAEVSARFGLEVETLSREAYAERGFEGPEQHGAVLVRPGFGVHPLQLARARAASAERAGARLFPRSEAVAWRREGRRHLLECSQGAIRADRVLLAANGFMQDRLHPAFAARAMPVLSMIGVTRPLTTAERDAHRWREDGVLCSARRMLYYFRMLPQGRLLFGMRGDLSGSEASAGRLADRLRAHLGQAFPHWRDIPLEHFWRGPVCMTRALRPSIGLLPDDPSVAFAFGWHGSGVNGATLGGRLAAGLLAGDNRETTPAPMRGLPPRIPAPGLRKVWLGAWLAAYRVRDRLDDLRGARAQ